MPTVVCWPTCAGRSLTWHPDFDECILGGAALRLAQVLMSSTSLLLAEDFRHEARVVLEVPWPDIMTSRWGPVFFGTLAHLSEHTPADQSIVTECKAGETLYLTAPMPQSLDQLLTVAQPLCQARFGIRAASETRLRCSRVSARGRSTSATTRA